MTIKGYTKPCNSIMEGDGGTNKSHSSPFHNNDCRHYTGWR